MLGLVAEEIKSAPIPCRRREDYTDPPLKYSGVRLRTIPNILLSAMTVVTQNPPSSAQVISSMAQTRGTPFMPAQTISSLPQYGFGAEHTFENLIDDNPYLFRVYTPKPRSPFFDNSEPFFVGQKCDDDLSCPVDQIAANSTYEDVVRHMDWTTRSSSPYISTSFSFVWAIWEAVRRYRANVKHDIEIAVIDARAVSGRAVTALELLRKGTPQA